MIDKVIVSVASLGRENYNKAQLRLIKSCVDAGWDGDYLIRSVDGYCDNYAGVPIKLGQWPQTQKHGICWQHSENPFQFKPFIIQEALEAGYTKIIWCDSTILMHKHPKELLQLASARGIVAFDNLGHPLGPWITDSALRHLALRSDEVREWKQIMACCIIMDFTVPITSKIFNKWIKASLENAFMNDVTSRPGFIDNRHDQSYLSALLNIEGIDFMPYGNLVYAPHNETGEYGNNFYFINKGL